MSLFCALHHLLHTNCALVFLLITSVKEHICVVWESFIPLCLHMCVKYICHGVGLAAVVDLQCPVCAQYTYN